MGSLWIKTEKKLLEDVKVLNNKLETDVCIIGGGITRNYNRILSK